MRRPPVSGLPGCLIAAAWVVGSLSLARPATAAEIEVAQPALPVVVDGDLREWGRAARIAIDPAADGVGMRGVFQGRDDHSADVLLSWDADCLYVAIAIEDDTLDVDHVDPADREWHGSGGQRKDRMFYHDHAKVFLREPGAPLGTNLWLAPPREPDGSAYWWGGLQRQPPVVRPEIAVSSRRRPGVYTFELALPWTWLHAYPQTGDRFAAMFLFTDADRPGEEVAVKIGRREDRWIWWQGDLVLRGTPAGLRQRPPAETPAIPEVAPPPTAALDPRVTRAIERSRQQEPDTAAAPPAASAAVPSPAAGATREASDSGSAGRASPKAAATPETPPPSAAGALRARLNRQRLGREASARVPDAFRAAAAGPALTADQVDSVHAVIRRTLQRVIEDEINARLDVLVVDMAAAAGCPREVARRTLVQLLEAAGAVEAPATAAWIAQASEVSRVDVAAARTFVHHVAERAGEVFADRGITTSKDLLDRGRRAADLDPGAARRLAAALLGLPAAP